MHFSYRLHPNMKKVASFDRDQLPVRDLQVTTYSSSRPGAPPSLVAALRVSLPDTPR